LDFSLRRQLRAFCSCLDYFIQETLLPTVNHQALAVNAFKKLFSGLAESKIIGTQQPLSCQILKSDKGFSIQCEESSIFWSDEEVESIKTMIELGNLKLCKF
jgi:hypothetical protein